MPENSHIPLVFYIVALAAVGIFIFNLRKFFSIKIGKKTELDLNWGKRIFQALVLGVGQKKVWSKTFRFASIMHFFLGWGFIELLFATTVDFFKARGWFTTFLPGLDTPWFAFLNELGGILLFFGLIMALYRRHADKPDALPQKAWKGRGNILGDTGILVYLLILVIGGFIAEAGRIGADHPTNEIYSWVGYSISKILSDGMWTAIESYLWWSHAIVSLMFIAILPTTKMFHAVAVLANLALTNTKTHKLIPAMHVAKLMEDPEADIENISLGANTVKDLTWKQLLDSISCTECARCTSVCPAHESGLPLSPMKIVTDIRAALYAGNNKDATPEELIGNRFTEEEIWSCTTCGHCMEVCPVMIGHVPTFTELRRHLVLSEGKPPTQASESLEKTLNTGNPWGYNQSDRLKWATDSGFDPPVLSEKKKADVLFWVGCAGSFDPRNQQVSRSIVEILENAGIDYAVLGAEETCTGDSARRMGEEYLFETMAAQNIDTLNKYEFKTIVTGCPHCFHTLGNEYKDFGGDYNVMHHTQFIDELVKEEKIKVNPTEKGTVTYHDSCYLGRHNDEYEAPRNLLQNVVEKEGEFVEMKRSGKDSFCCGAGGGNMWYEMKPKERMNLIRFQEAIDMKADTVATSCSFCMIMMDDAMKVKGQENSMKVMDIAELVSQSMTK